mgnify:CR=1 FL=1
MLITFLLMILIQYFFSYIKITVDVIFIFTFWINYKKNDISAIVYSFFAGVYMDFYYQFPFGVCALTMTLLSHIITEIRNKMDISIIGSRIISFIVMNYLFNFMLYAFSFVVTSVNYFNLAFIYLPFVNFIFFEIFRLMSERIYNKKCGKGHYA